MGLAKRALELPKYSKGRKLIEKYLSEIRDERESKRNEREKEPSKKS